MWSTGRKVLMTQWQVMNCRINASDEPLPGRPKELSYTQRHKYVNRGVAAMVSDQEMGWEGMGADTVLVCGFRSLGVGQWPVEHGLISKEFRWTENTVIQLAQLQRYHPRAWCQMLFLNCILGSLQVIKVSHSHSILNLPPQIGR